MAGRTSSEPSVLSVRNPGTYARGCRDTVRGVPASDSASPLRVERRDDGVVVLTLALPDRRNAMTGELTTAWGSTIAKLRGDRSVRCIVVTGDGSAFCAGGDLSWIAESPDLHVDAIRDRMLPFYRTWLSIRELEAPSIAAVNGHAIGGGLELAVACTMRIAAAGAKLGVPEARLGIIPATGGLARLPRLIGTSRAARLLLTGEIVTAAEAEGLGLVDSAVPADEVLSQAMELATRIAAAAPLSTRAIVDSLRNDAALPIVEANLRTEDRLAKLLESDDRREGARAFLERRDPDFTGS
jgi:enoyl-CoA hydratase/carnithine racemase